MKMSDGPGIDFRFTKKDLAFLLFYQMKYLFSFSQLDNYSIRESITLKVNVSIPNLRLFVGNIPKSKSQEEIKDEFSKRTGKC